MYLSLDYIMTFGIAFMVINHYLKKVKVMCKSVILM